jgi:mannose-1-phosphate guanylyltransferase / mannose-6-phosphate isomerase
MKIQPVILCGGSGTRLWPLSRKSLPKQFVPLIGGKSLLQLTFERVAGIAAKNTTSDRQSIWTVASAEHRFLVRDAAEAAGVTCTSILEPVGRNTAAAMAAAAFNAKPEQLLLFLPADHHVPDTQLFEQTVQKGVAAAQEGAFVTFGVMPSHPHTGYGYIKTTSSWRGGKADVAIHSTRDEVRTVERFVKKPTLETALTYIASGD